jgi:hypothetical protein
MFSRRVRRGIFIGLFALFAALAVAYTFTSAVPFSGFAAGVLKAAICVAIWVTFDEWVLSEFDTWDILKEDPIALAIALLALALLLAPAIATGQDAGGQRVGDRVVEEALNHVGVTETPPGSNEGQAVERYLASVDLGGGYAWCAAFARYVLDEANASRPAVRSAASTDYLTDRSLDATDVLRGTAQPSRGSIVTFRRGDTWKGHTAIARSWSGACGRTVEGNTSPADAGPQRDGQGVWKRHRCIHPGSYFRIVGFTPVK